MNHIRSCAAACLCVAVGLASTRAAAEPGDFQEYEVKATFLFHLAKFVEWPDAPPSSIRFELCVVGNDPFGSLIDFFQGRDVHGRELVVTRLTTGSPLDSCNLAFVGTTETQREISLLARARLARVLTVGESSQFTRHGGIVRFFVYENQVHLEINATAAKASGLSISGKLMSLADIVHHPVEIEP